MTERGIMRLKRTSSGALMVPFAFLAPRYDPQLQKVYPETSARLILAGRGLWEFAVLAMLIVDAIRLKPEPNRSGFL
jgi:hypothetical protein